MILFFDTETTGLPDRYTPLNSDRQPHCVQLAALLTEDDGTERASLNLIVHPDGWTIPEAAAKVHGITTEMAQRCGVREAIAAAAFYDLAKKADLLVAHNIPDDRMRVAKNSLYCWKGGALSDEDAIGMIVCAVANAPLRGGGNG